MRGSRGVVPVLASVLAAELPAQFVNRATWLGLDEESVRREFAQGPEYYLDRFGYVVLPPWWERGLPRFEDRVTYRLGSTSSTQFTVEGAFDQGVALGDGIGFRYHMLQSENRDTRFLRNAVELEAGFGARSAVFVQTELFAEKSAIDVSAGVWLWREAQQALRLMVTAVDAPSAKSREFEYRRDPYAVMASGAFGAPDGMRVAFEVGGQLPLEVAELATGAVTRLQRWIGGVDLHVPIGGPDWLVFGGELEWTWKELRAASPGDPLDEDFRRDYRQLRCEWWRDDERRPWSVGVLHTGLREDGLRPFDPGEDLLVRRDEWFGVVRVAVPTDGRLSFEPQLFAGHVRARFADGGGERHHDRFEGKVAWNARWDFSPRAWFAFSLTTQLDELAFGGGGAQLVVRF
jgi:hypothetical protein